MNGSADRTRRRLLLIGLWPILLAAAPPGRVALGQFGGWGAFRDAAPARCFAIAQPLSSGRDTRSSLALSTWPRLHAHDQLYIRLSRAATGATLEIGNDRFALVTRDDEAWAAGARDDARIAALLRRGGLLQIRATDARGRRFHDRYQLDGAASAIDAMRLGCLPA